MSCSLTLIQVGGVEHVRARLPKQNVAGNVLARRSAFRHFARERLYREREAGQRAEQARQLAIDALGDLARSINCADVVASAVRR